MKNDYSSLVVVCVYLFTINCCHGNLSCKITRNSSKFLEFLVQYGFSNNYTSYELQATYGWNNWSEKCNLDDNSSLVTCAMRNPEDNVWLNLIALDKTSNKIVVLETDFWNRNSPNCECSDLESPTLEVESSSDYSKGDFLSYKIKVDFPSSGDLTANTDETVFSKCIVDNKSQTRQCKSSTSAMKNFDLCQTGEVCVKYVFFQCAGQLGPKCMKFKSFLDTKSHILNGLQCQVKNGNLSASWNSLDLKEIEEFEYNVSTAGKSSTMSGRMSRHERQLSLDVGRGNQNYTLYLAPCLRCKCLRPHTLACQTISTTDPPKSGTTDLPKTGTTEEDSEVIPIVVSVVFVFVMCVVVIIIMVIRSRFYGANSTSNNSNLEDNEDGPVGPREDDDDGDYVHSYEEVGHPYQSITDLHSKMKNNESFSIDGGVQDIEIIYIGSLQEDGEAYSGSDVGYI